MRKQLFGGGLRRALSLLVALAMVLGLVPWTAIKAYADGQQEPLFTFSKENNTCELNDNNNVIAQNRGKIVKIEALVESEGAEWAQIQWGYWDSEYENPETGEKGKWFASSGGIDTGVGVHMSSVEGPALERCSNAQVQHHGNGKLWWAKVYFNDETLPVVLGSWVDVTSLTLSPTIQTLKVGEITTLHATIEPSGATVQKVTWSVANGKVKLYSDEQCTEEVGIAPTDATTVYAKGVAAGDETVTVNSDAVSNKQATCALTVNKGDSTAVAPTGLTATYGQTLADVSLEGKNPEGNTAGTWAWADGTQSVGDVVSPAATFKANFTPDDADNYSTVENVDVAVTVNKAANPTTVKGTATVVKGGNAVDLSKNVKLNGATGDVRYAIEGDAKGCKLNGSELTSGDGKGSVTVNVTVAEDANHYALAATPIAVTITDKAAQTIAAPDVDATYGDTDKRVDATTDGDGKLSYKVTSGDAVGVDASTGALTINKAGKATVTVTASETAACAKATKDVAVSVAKANATAATVTANDRTHDGTEQPLVIVDASTLAGGEMQYSLDGKTYSASVPKASDPGTYTVWYKVVGDANHNDAAAQKVTSTIAKSEPQPTLTGSGHVQGTGDETGTEEGGVLLIGTTGESRRLESITVSLPEGTDGGIAYRAHLQGTGWTSWTPGGQECGTRDESRRIESVQMTLSGAVADGNSVWYRVHSQTFGWLGWARDGQAAGTAGQSRRAEAVEVQLLPQGQVPKGYVEGEASYVGAVTADVHLQGTGWTGSASSLAFGTTGQSRRLEAISLEVENQPSSGGVSYEAHLQGIGWSPAEADGTVAGTVGESRRVEAVRVSLTGELSGGYSVWYRVHSQTYGWLGWAHDGADAGTTGVSRRAEAVEVQVLPRGQFPAGYDAAQAACLTE